MTETTPTNIERPSCDPEHEDGDFKSTHLSTGALDSSSKRKKNPGRSARRRLRNRREQQQQPFLSKRDVTGDAIATTDQDDSSAQPSQTFAHQPQECLPIEEAPSTTLSDIDSAVSWRSDREVGVPSVERLRQAKPEYWNADLDPIRLRYQLGFFPGNAVAVVARIGNCPHSSLRQHLTEHTSMNIDDDRNVEQDPLVLQLYPLACRNTFAGGRAQGRNFKSRRRGPQRNSTSLTQDGTAPETSISSSWVMPCVASSQSEVVNTDKDDSNDDRIRNDAFSVNVTNPSTNAIVVEPFPTMYWLTHPWLRTLVSQLELENFGSTLENRLAKDPAALKAMERAHLAYGQERFKLLSDDDVSHYLHNKSATAASSSSWEQALSPRRGVAGIRNFASIKCLHAHVAHYLSGGPGSQDNQVGTWTVEALLELLQTQKQQPYDDIGDVK